MNEPSDNDPEARLLDLVMTYPRVNKPALWEMLRRYDLKSAFLERARDVKAKEKDITEGVRWRLIPGSKIPNPDKVDNYNSEASILVFLYLFSLTTRPPLVTLKNWKMV